MKRFVLGVGLSSAATPQEVAALAAHVVADANLGMEAVTQLATRECFVGDSRLALGPEVIGVSDDLLISRYPVPAHTDRPGLPARVAEGCAMAAAGASAELLVARAASAHVTMALAQGLVEEIS